MMDIATILAAHALTQVELESVRLWNSEVLKTDNRRKLWRHGYKIFSQNDEDGIIAEIFRRIGIVSRTFIEFGCGDGSENNTAALLVQGWRGLWMDGGQNLAKIAEVGRAFPDRLFYKQAFITAENINELISSWIKPSGIEPNQIDLLSIDIDRNDFWVWQAIEVVKPRVVVIEYNALWPPPASAAVPYEAKAQWDGTNYFGASLEAMTKLGERKGYALVGCNFTGTNAFFVRTDAMPGGVFPDAGDAVALYEPVRYCWRAMRGHPAKVAPYTVIL